MCSERSYAAGLCGLFYFFIMRFMYVVSPNERYGQPHAISSALFCDSSSSMSRNGAPPPQKICLLTTFSHYESDAVLTRRGGFALLPAQLSFLLKTGAGGLKVCVIHGRGRLHVDLAMLRVRS